MAKWFNHPRVFWGTELSRQVYVTPLRERWALALRDPIYVGMWTGLISIIGMTILLVVLN